MKIPLKTCLFLFYFLIYMSSNGGHTDPFDGVLYLATSENIIQHHSILIPKYSDLYAKAGISSSNFLDKDGNVTFGGGLLLQFMAVPLYLLSSTLSFNPFHFVPYFLNSSIIALTALVLFLLSKEIFSSAKISFVLSLVFAVTSFVWPYATSMWQQPLVSLTLISSIYFVFLARNKKSTWLSFLSGIILGLTFMAHPGYIILIPGFLLYGIFQFVKSKKLLMFFMMGFFMISIIMALLNDIRFDSPLDFGYHSITATAHTELTGLVGLIISPGFGVCIFYPLFVIFPLSIYLLYRYHSKSLSLLCVYAFVSCWIFFGTLQSPVWASFANWGPRYLVPVIPFITIPLGAFLTKYGKSTIAKSIFAGLAIMGFSITIMGIFVWFMYGFSYGWESEQLWKVNDSYAVFAWNPYHSPILQNIKVLSSNYLSTVLQYYHNDYHQVGLAPCKYDNFLYCNFGITPLIVLGSVIFAISILIMKALYSKKITNSSI